MLTIRSILAFGLTNPKVQKQNDMKTEVQFQDESLVSCVCVRGSSELLQDSNVQSKSLSACFAVSHVTTAALAFHAAD